MAVNTARQDELMREVPKRETLFRLYRYLFDYKKELAAVGGLLAVTLSITLATPLAIELAVDQYVANEDIAGLLTLGAAALALFFVYAFCTRQWMMLMAEVTNKVLLTIRSQLYSHLQTLSFHFYDSRPTGKILARVVGDPNSLKDVLSDSVTKLIPDLLTIAGVSVIMLVKNWQLALAALLTLPVLCGGMFVIQSAAHRRWQVHRKKNSNLRISQASASCRVLRRSRRRQKISDAVPKNTGTATSVRCASGICSGRLWRSPGEWAAFSCILSGSASWAPTRSASVRFWHFRRISGCSGARSGIWQAFIISL